MFEEAPMTAGLIYILIAFPQEEINDRNLQLLTAKSLLVLSYNLTSQGWAMFNVESDPDKVHYLDNQKKVSPE